MLRFVAILAFLCVFAPFSIAASKAAPDDLIYDQVRMKLAADREVGAAGIDVKVKDGVVELHGVVKRDAVKGKAEKITKRVKGVRSVVNDLQVSTSGLPPAPK